MKNTENGLIFLQCVKLGIMFKIKDEVAIDRFWSLVVKHFTEFLEKVKMLWYESIKIVTITDCQTNALAKGE